MALQLPRLLPFLRFRMRDEYKRQSQEQLAEYLEVSRQSVSKWEADKTMPEISKLIAISELFQVSLDYLLIDDCENRNGRFPGMEDVPDYGAGKGLGGSDIKRQQDSGQWEMDAGWPETSSRETEEMKKSLNEIKEFIGCREGFEYKSKASVFGLPLVHVKFGGGNGKVRLRDACLLYTSSIMRARTVLLEKILIWTRRRPPILGCS